MSESITVTEVVRHFADYVSRVAYRGESFILVRGNKPVTDHRERTAPWGSSGSATAPAYAQVCAELARASALIGPHDL